MSDTTNPAAELDQALLDVHGKQPEPDPLTTDEVQELVIASAVVAKLQFGSQDTPDPMLERTDILWGYHPPRPSLDYDNLREAVEGMQRHHARWSRHNFGHLKSDYNAPFKGMVEELGELSHALLKQEQGIRGTFEEHEAKAKDAVGDLFVFMADLCTRRGWSLGEIIQQTWLEVSARDWRLFPKNGITE